MNRPFIRYFATLALIFSGQGVFNGLAQEKDYHIFTDKKGQTIEAAPLSITQGKSKLEIEFKDGRKFEIAILTLSLNDQQFIKDWLKDNPIKSDYKVEVSFEKHLIDTERDTVLNYGGLKWVTDTTTIEIHVKNRSREDLVGASLEYYIITEQGVNATILPPESQQTYGVKEWWYSNNPADPPRRKKGKRRAAQKKPLWLIHGKIKLKDLATNHTMDIKPDPFPLREISQNEGRNPKDVFIGVISRVTDDSGKEISVHRSNENKFLKRSWNEISQMPPGDQSGIPQPIPITTD